MLTKRVVVGEVKLSNLKESGSIGQAANRSLQFFLRQWVEDQVDTSASGGRHDVLLEGGVSGVGNIGLSELRTKILLVPIQRLASGEFTWGKRFNKNWRFSGLPTVVNTLQPMLKAMEMAAWPTPPVPAWIRTVSPGCMRPRTTSA